MNSALKLIRKPREARNGGPARQRANRAMRKFTSEQVREQISPRKQPQTSASDLLSVCTPSPGRPRRRDVRRQRGEFVRNRDEQPEDKVLSFSSSSSDDEVAGAIPRIISKQVVETGQDQDNMQDLEHEPETANNEDEDDGGDEEDEIAESKENDDVSSSPPSPSPSFSPSPLPSLSSSSSSSRSRSSGENGDSSPIHVAREKGASRKQRVGSVLDQLIEEQSSRLGARNNPVVWEMSQRASCRQGAQRFSDSENVWEEAEEEVSAVTRWARYLKHLPVDFFSSHEARMQFPVENMDAGSEEGAGVGETGMGGERRRCVAYAGLSLCHSPENCPDLLYCYEQYYEIKIQRGGRKEGYSQFRAVAGQLARFAVSAEVACAETFAVPGGLFNLVRESRLIRAFIGGFQQHAQASTVYSKATLLGGLCRMAKQHFGKISSSETPAVLSHIDETINLLGGFRRVEKATSRRHTAVMRDQDRRDAFIAPKDWFWLQKRIEEDMRRVLSGVCGLSNQLGLDVHVYLDENHNLRPQVYCSLQHPAERVVQKWEEESGNGAASSVKLYPKAEKTPRGTFSPGVLFPDTAGSFFATYSRMIRPAVMRGCGKVDRDLADSGRTFLVHTETGMALSGENLRNTLRYYVGGMGGLSGDLSRVTVMTVRASFASMMFRSFRQGSFPGQSCEEFLGELAETMNTSTEMLRNTYISANGKEFDEAASAFLRASRED